MKILKKAGHILQQYIPFLLLSAFTVTCCFLLFLTGTGIDEEIIRSRAGITFGNVIFLSIIFAVVDRVRRYLTVDRPVKKILNATERIAAGDYTTRIENFRLWKDFNRFDRIIENFNKMAEELSGAETLKTDFVANVSHEMKTPLAVIQNYATLLQTPDLPEDKRQEYANVIMQSTKRFSELITNLLKMNKLENQSIQPEAREFSLTEQLCDCLLSFEDIWEQKNIDIKTDLPDDIMVSSDAELLSLVWNNLFSNAFKFTAEGGTVCLSAREEPEAVLVSVSDTGCGIDAETGKHIFDKFYQGDTSHATAGNGLGLALVKRVMDITGNEISVHSELGKGSTFIVRLRKAYHGKSKKDTV